MTKIFDNIKDWNRKEEKGRQERAEELMRSKRIKELAEEELEKLRKVIEELKQNNV